MAEKKLDGRRVGSDHRHLSHLESLVSSSSLAVLNRNIVRALPARSKYRQGRNFSLSLSQLDGKSLQICTHTRWIFSHPSSRITLVYQSFCYRTIADRLYYDWIAEVFLDGQLKPWHSRPTVLHPSIHPEYLACYAYAWFVIDELSRCTYIWYEHHTCARKILLLFFNPADPRGIT